MTTDAPVVMISSTITELLDLRAKVERTLSNRATARPWLFEVHAVAAGSSPDSQYLEMAQACDLYVLIVADQQSDATEDEYRAAFADNPEKVLPFFVGSGNATVHSFRTLLESRHTRVQRPMAGDLAVPIAEAVAESVTSGRILRQAIAADLDRRIDLARRLVADVPVLLEPRVVTSENGTPKFASDLLQLGAHVALAGIGGSGKSLAVAICARRAATDPNALIIWTNASGARSAEELIERRFDAMRFQAGKQITREWARIGRILLVVDGLESLNDEDRRHLLRSCESFVATYPRSGLIVCARQFMQAELAEFVHLQMAPLENEQLDELASALGYTSVAWKMPDQMRDLGSWPLWATALLVFGPQASTALDLLQRIVEARLDSVKIVSRIERHRLRLLAGYVARRLWPETNGTVENVLRLIHDWSTEAEDGATFQNRSGEELILGLAEAGLVEMGDLVSIPHRLFASILASESLASHPMGATVDDELAPFVAAILDDGGDAGRLVTILSTRSIFVSARMLRLSLQRTRDSEPNSDVTRFADAYAAWSVGAAQLDIIRGERWTAWRRSGQRSIHSSVTDADFDVWRAEATDDISLWADSPFLTRSPEFIAQTAVLSDFRQAFLAMKPDGDPYRGATDVEMQRMMREPDQFDQSVLSAIGARRALRHSMLDAVDLSPNDLGRTEPGEPSATIRAMPDGHGWVEIAWGSDQPTVSRGDPPDGLRPAASIELRYLLSSDQEAHVYAEIVSEVERAIGCRLNSQSWSKPELVPAWTW